MQARAVSMSIASERANSPVRPCLAGQVTRYGVFLQGWALGPVLVPGPALQAVPLERGSKITRRLSSDRDPNRVSSRPGERRWCPVALRRCLAAFRIAERLGLQSPDQDPISVQRHVVPVRERGLGRVVRVVVGLVVVRPGRLEDPERRFAGAAICGDCDAGGK